MDYFPHQLEYVTQHYNKEYHGLWWAMGAGKTRAILDGAARLYAEGEIDTLVVIALKGVHTNWIRRQAPIWLKDVAWRGIVWNDKRRTKAWKEELEAVLSTDDALRIIAINIEAFSRKNSDAAELVRTIRHRSNASVLGVIDESSTIKDPKANKSKEVVKLSDQFKYRRVLTGTPITESPFNLFQQGEFLKRKYWGTSYYMFRQRYGQFRTARFGNRSFDELVSYRNLDDLKMRMQDLGTEVEKQLSIPKAYKVVDVELTAEQRRLYNEMLQTFAVQIDDDLITVENALSKLQKLQQIATGHIIHEDQSVTTLEHNGISTFKGLTDTINHKIIVFCKFMQPIKELMEALGDEAVEYSGRIDDEAREQAVDRFQSDPSCKFIVISTKSNAVFGLDLYAAGVVIYYNNDYSLERRMQSEDGAHRPGNKHDRVVYYDFVRTDTVDEDIQEAFANKIDVASQVTRLMRLWLRPRSP